MYVYIYICIYAYMYTYIYICFFLNRANIYFKTGKPLIQRPEIVYTAPD